MKKILSLVIFIIGLIIGIFFDKYILQNKKDVIETTQNIELFKVFGADKESQKLETNFYISVPTQLPIIEKLKIFADKLSRFEFGYLPIEVLKIENQNNKKIVIINLKEDNEINKSWRNHYFQGSCNGFFTSAILTQTFLQNEYKGNWIDGVQFLYENKPIIEEDWDHINLSGIKFRNPI